MNIYLLAFTLLMVLKLANLATISWWIVFAPLIAWPIIFMITIFIIALFR